MPGKTIPFEMRLRLGELKGVRLAIWLAYLLHSNRDGVAWPGLRLLARETGYNLDVVSDARNELIRQGWLRRLESQRQAGGRFAAPRLAVEIPDTDAEKSSSGRKATHGEQGGNRMEKTSAQRKDKISVRSINNEDGSRKVGQGQPTAQALPEDPWELVGLPGGTGDHEFDEFWKQLYASERESFSFWAIAATAVCAGDVPDVFAEAAQNYCDAHPVLRWPPRDSV